MDYKLKQIEALVLEALKDAELAEPHDDKWRSFVTRLGNAKVAIWHAMEECPEGL